MLCQTVHPESNLDVVGVFLWLIMLFGSKFDKFMFSKLLGHPMHPEYIKHSETKSVNTLMYIYHDNKG